MPDQHGKTILGESFVCPVSPPSGLSAGHCTAVQCTVYSNTVIIALPSTHDTGTSGNNTSPTVNTTPIIDTKYCTSYDVNTTPNFLQNFQMNLGTIFLEMNSPTSDDDGKIPANKSKSPTVDNLDPAEFAETICPYLEENNNNNEDHDDEIMDYNKGNYTSNNANVTAETLPHLPQTLISSSSCPT